MNLRCGGDARSPLSRCDGVWRRDQQTWTRDPRVDDPVRRRLAEREVEGSLHVAEGRGLDDLELELARDRGLDARACIWRSRRWRAMGTRRVDSVKLPVPRPSASSRIRDGVPTRQHSANASRLKSGRRTADRRAHCRPAPCARRPCSGALRQPRQGNTSSYQHQYACRRGCRRSASAGSSRRRRATPARGPCTRRAC